MNYQATHIGRAFEAIQSAADNEENVPESIKTNLRAAMGELAYLMIELGSDERRMHRLFEGDGRDRA